MLNSISSQAASSFSNEERRQQSTGKMRAEVGTQPINNQRITLFSLPAQAANAVLLQFNLAVQQASQISPATDASINESLLYDGLKKCLAIWQHTLPVLHWLTLLPVHLLVKILATLLAPILPVFAEASGFLPNWLWWFQTPDNSLDGDKGWKYEHWQWRYNFPTPIAQYIGRVGWLIRNPSYGFSGQVLAAKVTEHGTLAGEPKVSDNPYLPGYRYIHSGKYFEFYGICPTIAGKCLRMRLGWKLGWPINMQEKAQYVSSINFFKTPRNQLSIKKIKPE